MAKYFTGTNGAFLVDSTQTAKVSSWSLNAQVSTLETTTLGDHAREYIAGVQSFSGTATLYYYIDANNNLDNQQILNEVIRTGPANTNAQHSLTLRLQELPARQVKLKVIITSASISATVGEIVTAEISFTGTEPLQEASLTQ